MSRKPPERLEAGSAFDCAHGPSAAPGVALQLAPAVKPARSRIHLFILQ
jgi:hypothetical protein